MISDRILVTVRHAREADLESIFEIIRDRKMEFAKQGQKYAELTEEEKVTWLPEIKRPETLVVVVQANGKVVGHTNLGQRPNYPHDCAYVFSLTVLSNYRRRGLGRILLASALYEAKEILKAKTASLCVAEPNPARFLYENLGFRYDGEFQGEWIGRQVKRFLMSKQL